MDEFFKQCWQIFLFPFMVVTGGDIEAKEGTLKYYLLMWLYGNPEPQHSGWIYPEETDVQHKGSGSD